MKGFRKLNQAQLLGDQLYYADTLEAQQWLIYYISKPLSGSYEPIRIPPALPFGAMANSKRESARAGDRFPFPKGGLVSDGQRPIKSFNDVLGQFPLIARQMQNGLERVFREARQDIKERIEARKAREEQASSEPANTHRNGSIHTKRYEDSSKRTDESEEQVRQRLEAIIAGAIDLFQQVDKQQLSVLGSTTSLTGIAVEHLIERYVTEQLHDPLLFPFLCDLSQHDDTKLESNIRGMQHVDLAQVGITIEGEMQGKRQLMDRIARAVEEFRKLGVAGSPHQMMEILLATQKLVTSSGGSGHADHHLGPNGHEKPPAPPTTNADTLVSLLLLVVIRSQIRHLNARLAYMQNFIFLDDVDAGEMGYALSTFEAVLSYLATDSGGLRMASKKNKKLWQCVTDGAVDEVKFILDAEQSGSQLYTYEEAVRSDSTVAPVCPRTGWNPDTIAGYTSEGSTLDHVFPFQISTTPRKPKRVSMDMRSISNASEYSFLSRTTTLDSRNSVIEGDISVETLSQTQDGEGRSLLMMAVEARQAKVLEYLLSREDLFPLHFVFEDCDLAATTLLSAAVQLSDMNLVETLLNRFLESRDGEECLKKYFEQPDKRGRTVAHYIFNAPSLIPRFFNVFPWTLKDKNGQTPLFALCRSYDHPEYSTMVNQALQFATQQQNDGEPLHLDDHVDGKRNTLLHVINDPSIAARILQFCDSDVNAPNDKQFTPLMVASKYGRMDMVRALFGDRRVDPSAKELRGMTAVELAKDDEVRNRIDDMVLVSNVPAADGRVTSVVRSFFVDDASVRMIIKSAVRNDDGMIGVTTCRRSLSDFENLAKWLAIEHPASWLPSVFNFRSAFQIPGRPSRAVLQDIQVRLDRFLKIMLAHSTFSTHELLWEFILFPEIQPEMMAERSRTKANLRAENVREENEPLTDVREVSSFVEHARDSIRAVSHCTKSVTRRLIGVRVGLSSKFKSLKAFPPPSFSIFLLEAHNRLDVAVASDLLANSASTIDFLPQSHILAFTRCIVCIHPYASDPFKIFHQDFQAILTTILAILSSLARPHSLINSCVSFQKAIDRYESSSRRSDRWPLGLLDETRRRIQEEAQEKAKKGREDLHAVGCELRYTQQTVASELAGWQDLHIKLGRRAIRSFAEKMVIREKDRLQGMQRAVRGVVELKEVKERGRRRERD